MFKDITATERRAVLRAAGESDGSYTGTFAEASEGNRRLFGLDPQRAEAIEITSPKAMQDFARLGDGRRILALNDRQLRV